MKGVIFVFKTILQKKTKTTKKILNLVLSLLFMNMSADYINKVMQDLI